MVFGWSHLVTSFLISTLTLVHLKRLIPCLIHNIAILIMQSLQPSVSPQILSLVIAKFSHTTTPIHHAGPLTWNHVNGNADLHCVFEKFIDSSAVPSMLIQKVMRGDEILVNSLPRRPVAILTIVVDQGTSRSCLPRPDDGDASPVDSTSQVSLCCRREVPLCCSQVCLSRRICMYISG